MAVTLWLVRRPFLMPRARWTVSLAFAVGAALVAWVVLPTVIAVAFASLPLLIAAVLLHWWWLVRLHLPAPTFRAVPVPPGATSVGQLARGMSAMGR